ncbi:bifunctional UDP-sugar hydrolase/5'-nucleotidase UshA [uncultured Ferrimonas sp.]|uniref:bifunctional UDP-sugar hydrolase/5'-nucleotidase UshA n=1 Tax=uncultured Ferrimonas sp. TaxID=432640 RepID=UPI00262110F3|nr:bifunctional UDP-sugar hydrolase/5'-nucleotidase UshA [uncultured Ferrimonas sp.]
MKTKYSLITASLLLALAGCNGDSNNDPVLEGCEAAAECTKFTILHTNDNHGRFWENKYGEYGMAARKTLIDQIRTEVKSNGGYSLLLSGGDVNTGVPESDLQDAEPDFIGMNLIGYDAMAVGNHEFDNPLSVLENQRDWADFPMLAANIYDKNGDRYFKPYKIFFVGDVRIAVVGLTTEDTAKLGNPEYISELTFTDPKEEIKKVIKEIEEAGSADLVFATTHMGHYADGASGSNAPGDVALARALEEGQLAAVIGGHSQNPVCMAEDGKSYDENFAPGSDCKPDQQNGTYIMQAHEWGKYVGRADFEYYDGELHLADYKLVPVNLKVKDENGDRVLVGEEIAQDSEIRTALYEFQLAGQEQLDEKIAETNGKLEGDRNTVRAQQTNLGHLIASAHADKVDADFAVMNSGGVRDSIEAGDVTYRDVLTVQPFGNMVTLSTKTGAEITEYLNTVATFTSGSGAYAQLVGIKLTVDCDAQSVEIHEINGKTFNAADTYSFTVPSYNAAGGDGYPALDDAVQTGYVDADVMYGFMKELSVINVTDFAPVDGDITYINSDITTGCSASAE